MGFGEVAGRFAMRERTFSPVRRYDGPGWHFQPVQNYTVFCGGEENAATARSTPAGYFTNGPTRISSQSYANCLPQSRQTTYVAAEIPRRASGVMGRDKVRC